MEKRYDKLTDTLLEKEQEEKDADRLYEEGVEEVKQTFRSSVQMTTVNVASFVELQRAISLAPLNGTPTIIDITNSFVMTSTLNISGGRNIVIQSSDERILIRTSGRHFQVQANSSFTIESDVILDGNDQGGGVLVSGNNANITMNGGTITNCRDLGNGGGVSITHSGASFTMMAGTISGNTASGNGGGILSSGSFTLEGGTISDNIGTNGGGVNIQSSGSFTMTGGTISDNMGTNGGGISISPGGSLILTEAIISRNTAINGGGGIHVSSLNSTHVVISSEAKFSGNSAESSFYPPIYTENEFLNIQAGTTTIHHHPLNNVDIGFQNSTPSLRTLSMSKNPEAGGLINVEGEAELSEVGFFGEATVKLVAVPALGYRFTGWLSSNGGTFVDPTSSSTTITLPDSDTTITANFELEPEKEKITFLDFFPDENLAQGVAEYYDRIATDPVTRDELEGRTAELFLNDLGVKNLEGMQYFINLRILRLANNEIEDLGPLSDLTHLRFLTLQNNTISDLEPLSGLEVTNLWLASNQIINIEPLSQITTLRELGLNHNQITDVSALSELPLTYLVLSHNHLLDISPVGFVEELTATNQSITLDPINQGEVTEGIFIKAANGQVPSTLIFEPTGGAYRLEDGSIIWGAVGQNTLTWNDTNFSGTISQYVME